MPVTAKLSKAFYERLGEDVANELVEWFNLVDATYRSDLRDINELNFARFDAKMEQRLAQLEAQVEKRFAEVEVKMENRFAEAEAKAEQRFGRFEARITDRLDSQNRGLAIGWASLFAALLGLFLKSL